MRLTVSLRCWERPQRTRRMIDCCLAQESSGYEILVVGDGCPYIQEIIDSGEYAEKQIEMKQRGNSLIIENLEQNYGGFGYEVIRRNIESATGKYFLFLSNDDIILPNHFQNYLEFIESKPELDFAYFDTWLKPLEEKRVSKLEFGSIGHAELILKTEIIKKMKPHTSDYGHDWLFIKELILSGALGEKAVDKEPTYWVMSLPGNRETGID